MAPAACVAADVAADTADVADEPDRSLADAAGPAAEALDGDSESATVETAVWPVDAAVWPVEAAWPTAEDTSAVTAEVLATVSPAVAFSAVAAPGLVDADADRAVRRETTMATPIAAMAMPAAHAQNRRTLVTSPLVTTVTLIRSRRSV